MDKIETANWSNYFGHLEQTVLHTSERYTETVFRFEEPDLASGKIQSITTPGMVLTEFYMAPRRPFALCDVEGTESAESIFVLNGHVESRFENLKTPLHFGQQHHSFQYNTNFEGQHIVHSADFHTFSITYNLDYLNSVLQSAETGSLNQIGKSIQRKENFLAAPYALHWQARMAEVIQAMRQCTFQGLTRYLFVESKMLELFVLQIEHLQAVQAGPAKEQWRSADKEKLYAVKAYIEQCYLEPLTLKDLTYRFGLNEFKLKKGYKHFFQTTVFGHVHHLRMQKAKALLTSQDMTVAEVAYTIGYNNTGSFSTEFKKRFGYTPRALI
jgi:AraC family transcriptional regulator, transcriptional activator of the genes for pyochelin and ferripyochelin receptors